MRTFLPTLFSIIGVAVIIGIVIVAWKLLDSHYNHKAKNGYMSEEEAEKKKSSGIKTILIIVGIVLALMYVGARNYQQIEEARKEEREIAQEKYNQYEDQMYDLEREWSDWYDKGYKEGYEEGYKEGLNYGE